MEYPKKLPPDTLTEDGKLSPSTREAVDAASTNLRATPSTKGSM